MSEFQERYYHSEDGLQLYYRLYGAGAAGLPVVCLPGITRNSRDFEDLAEHLSARYPVITPDLRGRGLSDRDPDWQNYQPLTYVGDVQRLLDEAGLRRAVFIGTSLGGLVSTVLAANDPARVVAVVLNDIGPEIGAAGLERIKGYIGRAAPVDGWDDAVRQARELYELAWPGLSDKDWQRLVRRSYRENTDGVPVLDMDPAIGDAARNVGTGLDDPWALFAALREIPALVLQGQLSDILTDEIVARMCQQKPDLEHVVVANRGHVPLLDENDSLQAIDDFLARLQ